MDKLVDAKAKAIIYTLITSLNDSLGYVSPREQEIKDIINQNANMAESLYKDEWYKESD